MKTTIIRAVFLLALISPFMAAMASPESTVYSFDIPRESIDRALLDISRQSGLQVARLTDSAATAQDVGPLSGRFTIADALQRLLAGSTLSYRIVNGQTIAIEPRVMKATSEAPRAVAGKSRKLDPVGSDQQPFSAPSGNLADIVISASRVAGSLEFAPVAANTLDGSRLQAANLTNLTEITTAVPDFTFRAAPSLKDQGFVLRGLGTISTSPGVEPSVSTVVDGVVLARQGQAMMGLLDIDHIDVLKGPQGTLFGMNSSGGVIKIVTKRPSFQSAGHVDFGYFDSDEFRSQASFTGPIVSDRIAARASFMVDSYPGNVVNIYNGDNERVNGYQDYGARTQFLIRGAGSTRFLVTADYTHTHETTPEGDFAEVYKPAFAAVIAPAAAAPDSLEVNSNYDTYDLDANYGYSLQADWQIGDLRAISITAWRDWTNVQHQDIGRAPGLFIGFPQEDDVGKLWFQQVSEEFRLATQGIRRLDYVAGLFLFEGRDHENYQRATTVYSGSATTAYSGFANYGTVNRNGAIFGDATLHFTRHVSAIAGARAIHEELNFNFGRVANVQKTVPGIQPAFAATGSTDDTNYMGRLGLQADLPISGIAYLTWSRGYKGPAYNPAFSMLPQDTMVVKPEISHDWEAGLKMPLFEHTAHLDLSLFDDTVMDFQVPWYDVYNGSPITRLINAGQVTTRGVELGLAARLLASASLHGDLAYDPTRIDHFICPIGTSASCNVTGKTLPYQPEWEGVFGFDLHGKLTTTYSWLFGMDARAQTSVQYSINQTPQTIQGGYAIFNGYVGLDSDDGWQVRALVKNIADKPYSSYFAYSANYLQRFAPRDDHRYFGITVHKEF